MRIRINGIKVKEEKSKIQYEELCIKAKYEQMEIYFRGEQYNYLINHFKKN
jgi:hypothetical protein